MSLFGELMLLASVFQGFGASSRCAAAILTPWVFHSSVGLFPWGRGLWWIGEAPCAASHSGACSKWFVHFLGVFLGGITQLCYLQRCRHWTPGLQSSAGCTCMASLKTCAPLKPKWAGFSVCACAWFLVPRQGADLLEAYIQMWALSFPRSKFVCCGSILHPHFPGFTAPPSLLSLPGNDYEIKFWNRILKYKWYISRYIGYSVSAYINIRRTELCNNPATVIY